MQTIIIGGGQAGLAAAYHLGRRGLSPKVLEAHAALGDNWRQRWEGLRLFTPTRYSSLPGLAFPGDPYGLPDRLRVGDYLAAYAKTQDLDVELDAEVTSVVRDGHDGSFRVTIARGRTFVAESVIVAAGAYRTARVPRFAERLPTNLPQRHTSELRDLHTWPGPAAGRVLVVGAGASGTQVADLLSANHEVVLAGRDPGALPRSVFGRDVYDYLYGLGLMQLHVDTFLGRRVAGKPGAGEIGVGEGADEMARRTGAQRCGRIERYHEGIFVTSEGELIENIDAVVFATGYANEYPFLHVPGALDADGKPVHDKGVSPVKGLYWIGLHMMRRMSSSLLGGVGADAEFVAGVIARTGACV